MALSRTAIVLLKLGEKSYKTAMSLARRLNPSQRRKVARMLIQHGFAWVVAHNLDLFDQLDAQIGVALVAAGQDLAGHIARNISIFGDQAAQDRVVDSFRHHQQGWALAHVSHEKRS